MEPSSRAYDVFLSHRGPDTKNFCAFLKEALRRAGVHAFVDELDLEVGAPESAWTTMQNALQDACCLMPVLSQGYLQSSWCLDELVLMVQSPEKVVPVFLNVSPDALVDSLARGRLRGSSPETLEAWTTALNEVATIANFEGQLGASGYAPQMVKRIVKDVLGRLAWPALPMTDTAVDLERRVAEIKQRLADQAALGAAVLGLYGMGGIGKTTLAKAVYNDLCSDFVGSSCFLEIGSGTDRPGLQQLQHQMLRELCGYEMEVNSVGSGRKELDSRLSSARVLLVIDDIWSTEQLDALLVSVGLGSCVLVTTRNKALLDRPGISLQLPVIILDTDASLELFCRHAFLAGKPPAAYAELAAEAVEKCAGLPLTIKVLGEHLYDQPNQESWRAALMKLQAAQPLTGCQTEDDELWGKLRLSYDALGSAEQQMFLDIACCMLGKERSAVLPAWGHGARITLGNLFGRSLVSVSKDGKLQMHDQLRDMARAIVVMANRTVPALRSHVWMPEALQVAADEQDMGAIEVLSMAGCHSAIPLGTCNPRLLDLGQATLSSSDLTACTRLVYLEWHAAQHVSALPIGVAVLNLSGSPLSVLPATLSTLAGLQTLDLNGCNRLTELPVEMSRLTALRHLDMRQCTSVSALHEHLSMLTGLSELRLSNCHSLTGLPEGIGALRYLSELDVSGCRGLQRLPESTGQLTSLQRLLVCGLQELPKSTSCLTFLQTLELSSCPGLRSLPAELGMLTRLRELRLVDCSAMCELPASITALCCLQTMHIKSSDATAASSLQELPEEFGALSSLQELSLESRSLTVLPASLARIRGMQSLEIYQCPLADLPPGLTSLACLKQLSICGCAPLTHLPDNIGALSSLQSLKLWRCTGLHELPHSIGGLAGLTALDMCSCSSLKALPPTIGALSSLKEFSLAGCSQLEVLSEGLGGLTSLRNLDLSSCESLQQLPESMGKLVSLRDLNLERCSSLRRFPSSITGLTSLSKLCMTWCPAELPANLALLNAAKEGKRFVDVDDPPSSSQHGPESSTGTSLHRRALTDRPGQSQDTGTLLDPQLPPDLVCCISGEVFQDPVILSATGKTYERWAIVRWLQERQPPTCPLSGNFPLPASADLSLVTDAVMLAKAAAWRQAKQVHESAQQPAARHEMEPDLSASGAPSVSPSTFAGLSEARSQVVLYQEPAATGRLHPPSLSMEQHLQPGMQFAAYYPEDHDSEALHGRIEVALHALMQDSSAILVEFATQCSTVIYITVVKASADVSVRQLTTALKRNSSTGAAPKVYTQHGDDCFFELREEGGYWAFFTMARPPSLRKVLHIAIHLDGGLIQFLVVHGSNLLCHSDVVIKWRLGGISALHTLDPIHPDYLVDHNAKALLAERDSVAYVPPLLHLPASDTLHLEAWRGQNAIGGRIAIPISALLQGTPLHAREETVIQQQPGVSDWREAAAAYDPPSPYMWDVFISHAGNKADKPFAHALRELLKRCWPDTRVFLDDASLRPGADAQAAMQQAMESTHVAVLLLSAEFFHRTATRGELDVLLERHRLHRVRLLPVFLRLTFEDCKQELTSLYGPGCPTLPTGVRHLRELSSLEPGETKMDRETLWHIAHASFTLIRKDFNTGVQNYARSCQSPSR